MDDDSDELQLGLLERSNDELSPAAPIEPPIKQLPVNIKDLNVGKSPNDIYESLLQMIKYHHDGLAAGEILHFSLRMIKYHHDGREIRHYYFLDRKNRFDVNHRFPSEHNDTLLMLCAKYGLPDLATEFIIMGADINARGDKNFTALHCAAMADQGSIAWKLLKTGAKLEAETSDGDTAFHFAAMNNCASVISVLRWYNVNVNAKNSQGLTPLHLALENGHERIVRRLLEIPELDISDWRQHISMSLKQCKIKEVAAIEKLLLNAEKNGWGFTLPLPPAATSVNSYSSLFHQYYNRPESPEIPAQKRKSENIMLYLRPKAAAQNLMLK